MASSHCTYLFHFELVGGRSPRLRNFRVDLRAPIFSPFELFAPCFISHSDNDGNVSPQLQLQIKYKTLLVPFCFTFSCVCVRRASQYKYRPMATNHEMNRELGVGGVASFCQRQNASNGRYVFVAISFSPKPQTPRFVHLFHIAPLSSLLSHCFRLRWTMRVSV